jgi:hypothetical protein
MLLRPEDIGGSWIGKRAASYGGTQAITQAVGARDLSLGVGALAALTSGKDARDWVAAGAFADLGDLVATATADDIPVAGRMLVLALAGSAIAIGVRYLAGAQSLASG